MISEFSDIVTIPYGIPEYSVKNGINYILNVSHEIELSIFGKHNVTNINGARLICNQLGISNEEFYDSVNSFEGTANRLELVNKNGNKWLFKDFAPCTF